MRTSTDHKAQHDIEFPLSTPSMMGPMLFLPHQRCMVSRQLLEMRLSTRTRFVFCETSRRWIESISVIHLTLHQAYGLDRLQYHT